MLTLKNYEKILDNGISFKFSKEKNYLAVYKNDRFLGNIFPSSDKTIYFCGNNFVQTTSKDLFEFFEKISLFV